jgi:predicted Zn-dependent protease with MMP-like domain/Tfp pilus assembly protein PilF
MSRADRLQTLVERGFVALDGGDPEAAARALDQARRISRDDAGVLLLDAALLDDAGDPDAALVIYHRLAEAHPDDPVPHVHAGGVYLYSKGDPNGALEAADRAIERVEEDDELAEAIQLKVRALAALGRADEAATALRELDTSIIDDPQTIDAIADAALEAGQASAAITWWQRLANDDEWGADAWYGIGCAREAQGDGAAQAKAWLETRRRDAGEPPAPWHLAPEAFEEIAAAALGELPDAARERLTNVPVLVDDLPSENLVKDGVDPRVLGLFEGTPMPAESVLGGGPTVTTIHLFQRNLEAAAADADDLREQIRITVLHETAHFFGLDEDDLEAIGLD